MEKEKTCCFTGHRPQKLAWGCDETNSGCLAVKEKMRREIEKAVLDGFEDFLCGMAIGGDFYFAEEVLNLKENFPHIRLVGVIPCLNQERGWRAESRLRYQLLCKQCDTLFYVTKSDYINGCMQKRNQFLINSSSRLLCLYNGESGGTRSTVNYAYKKGVEVVNLF